MLSDRHADLYREVRRNTIELDVDARTPLTDTQIRTIAGWRTTRAAGAGDASAIVRHEARRLAVAVLEQTALLKDNHRQLGTLAEQLAPGLQAVPGLGPVTAAIIVCAYSHRGRVRSEAAFAALGGIAPLPASPGNTNRHRLSRSGDRQLNRAFAVRSRMSYDPTTRDYVARRRAEGRSNRRSAAASSATSAAPSSASSKPPCLDTRHGSVICGATPARSRPRRRISFSCSSRRALRRSCTSSFCSVLVCPSTTPSLTSACRTQRRTDSTLTSKSAVTSAWVRSPRRATRTTSRLNSSGNPPCRTTSHRSSVNRTCSRPSCRLGRAWRGSPWCAGRSAAGRG